MRKSAKYKEKPPLLSGKSAVGSNPVAEAKKELISLVAADPNNGEYALDLLMIAKYLERIGDHAVNIAEWAYYSVSGLHDKSVN